MSTFNFPFNTNNGNPYAQATIGLQASDGSFQQFQMEIDSGADITSFPASAAKTLGLDIKKGQVIQMQGVDNTPFNVYILPVLVSMQGTTLPQPVPIAFADIENFDTLLGRQGLWPQFQSITFDQVGQQTVFTLA